MADFRRWLIALSVLALMAGLASAQIGTAGSTSAGPLACTANAAGTPQIRSEGYTELVGDILITCTGGPLYAPGTAIPTTNITVYVTPNIPITSRLLAAGGPSEVVLIIDDAGSGLPTDVSGAYGPKAPQSPCADTSGSGGCAAFVGSDPGVAHGPYEVAVSSSGGATAAANVYQGNLNQVGPNTVTFYGVPVLPPVTSGVTRTFRITNIRVPAVGLGNGAGIQVFLSTSPSTVLPVSLASLPVAIVVDPSLKTSILNYQGGTSSAKNALFNFQQCQTVNAATVDLVYQEGFPTAFKTRQVPFANTLWNSQDQQNALGVQNIPGGLYGGFAANSESGFIATFFSGNSGKSTAGLADFGTRLKAVFTNIPAGITLYVSGANKEANGIYTGTTTPQSYGGTSTQSAAVLWSSGAGSNGEGQADGTNFSPASSSYSEVALTPNSSGVATAIWEVVNSNPSAVETFTFTVYVGWSPAPGSGITTSNPYGLPQITSILGAPVNNVALSYAPEPSQGAFSAASATSPATNPIPRFAIVHPFSGPFVSIILCQTTLLYPFVTANPSGGLGQGFDTGIAVANTSVDPFFPLQIPTNNGALTPAETGSCTLYPYGVSISSTGTQSAAPNPLPGCDTITNPVPGTNCFPIVVPGSVQTVLASQVFPTFQGYVIAVCRFQYAHGYAAVTDLGLRGLFSSYLAIELNQSGAPGQVRGISLEYNSH